MPRSGAPPTPMRSLAARAGFVFLVCGLAGYWFAPSSELTALAPVTNVAATSNDVDSRAALSLEVQQLLAQGGCPGWMALASDPNALQSPATSATYSGPLRTTADRRVADNRPLELVQLPPVSEDDLISEQEDLLFSSPEIAGSASPSPAGAAPDAIEPSTEVQTPSPSDEPATSDPVAAEAAEADAGAAVPGGSATPAEESAAEPAPVEMAPTEAAPAAPLRQYSPQELLRDAPLSVEPPKSVDPPSISTQPAPAATAPATTPPQPSADEDDLLSGVEDLLDESNPPANQLPAAQPNVPPVTPPQDNLLNDRGDLLVPAPNQPAPSQQLPPPAASITPPTPAVPVTPTTPPAGAPAYAPHSVTGPGAKPPAPADAQSRCEFIADTLYPSAKACRTCHEKIYDEWSMSSHAYSAVSPMFHKFEQKINDLTQGTIGYFCYRCHSPAGTALGISRGAPIYDAPRVAQEGVTCVACHRVREFYGKTNGERRIEPGDIYAPVYGSIGGDGVAKAVAEKANYKVKTSPNEPGPGQPIHAAGFTFPQLCKSEFCTSCHQVAVYPGIKLEVVWEQYRASPACKKGVSCQDCHMGRIPGVPSGYESGPAALINNKHVHPNRKHANHTFYGPGYSIAHPGVFPWHPKADRWTMREWLLFDWRAGWGTDAFEDAVADGAVRVKFPAPWEESDDRCDARDIIEDNLKKKAIKNQLRAQVMENGSHVDGPFFDGPQQRGVDLNFSYVVANTNEGHNLPTASLGAQPQLWANVVLIGPRGQRIWESGYLDRQGDLADIHSEDVRTKQIEYDWQLFNLQTMFLITGAKGTDREFFLPVNIDIDPLPFIRPAGQPVSVLNHPPFIRMEARSLAPLGSRRVPYRVPGHLLCEPGRYRLSFRMRNRTEPMYFMRFCESTVEMQRAMIDGTLDFHQSSVEFDVR